MRGAGRDVGSGGVGAADTGAMDGAAGALLFREERLRVVSPSFADFRPRVFRDPPAGDVDEVLGAAGSGAGEGLARLTSSPIAVPFSDSITPGAVPSR
jgi:hypothetical protein